MTFRAVKGSRQVELEIAAIALSLMVNVMQRMQWTVRSMLLAIAGISMMFAVARVYGLAVTATSLAILSLAGIIAAATSSRPRTKRTRITVIAIVALAWYTGSFATFRAVRTFTFSLAHHTDPQSNLVIFSTIPTAQELARYTYLPLINACPCHCYYPTGDEMRLLNHDPFSGEQFTLLW